MTGSPSGKRGRRLSLAQYFLEATVPLRTLDTVIDMTSKVRKVLMRSTPDDVVVIMTNNIGHSFVLSRGGKEVWLPEQWNLVYSYIIDIAFLEGTLYAITQEEDLFPIHIDLDGDGKFIIARGKRIIRQPTSSCGYSPWTVFDGEEDEARTSEKEATETSDEDDGEEGEVATPENKKATSTEDGDKAKEYDGTLPDCFDYVKEDVPHGSKALSITVRYLVESRMKLLMVRQHVQVLTPLGLPPHFSHRVEVFEAGTDTWVPVTNGLGGGRALFISMCFSKSVPTLCGEIEDDTIYFANTGEVFNMRSQTCSPPRWSRAIPFVTWVFSPEPMV
ncbi:hypothetical protein ZWY2020_008449 [Hordeum vulgare]|nr:hypothetical protein ZWY2020_008449 [Hordeum vulgare]